ncbi:hypothetical protein [Methanolapillus ohkumae]|uniref:GIY-YIG nuclease family protein n=1 Tax=Methanolapillus ohkumae TaxID=3028298 RepID=A0AA96V548_9EURY|nr:hypothetical protein MsAm2_05480 [Methanosarcinaceae archaeon Am2]
MKKKKSYKYALKRGSKPVYYGITNNLKRRESEHRKIKKFDRLVKIGRACKTESARKWEKSKLKTHRKTHHGRNPIYNKNKTG